MILKQILSAADQQVDTGKNSFQMAALSFLPDQRHIGRLGMESPLNPPSPPPILDTSTFCCQNVLIHKIPTRKAGTEANGNRDLISDVPFQSPKPEYSLYVYYRQVPSDDKEFMHEALIKSNS